MGKAEPERAAHACSTCKHSHRRCDRAMPICTGCKTKGKKCSYDELPKKPGPKSIHYHEEEIVEPLPLPIVKKAEIDYYPSDELPTDTAIDNYFDSICYYTPMFDRGTIHDVFEYRTALREHKLTELESIPSKQDRALLFALQALFYKKIHISADSHSAELSRKMMAGHFDTVLLDNKMACAYLLLGMYYKCENNMERCRFYVNNVNLAIAAWKENNQIGDLMIEDDPECFRMNFLEVYLKSLTIPDSRENLMLYLKTNLYLNSVIERYNEMYDFGGAYHPGTQFDEYIQPYLGLIKEDIDNKTNTRFPIDLKTVDNILTNISKSVEGHKDMNVLTVNRRNILLFAEGVKIQLLLKAGHHTSNTIRACADRIAENAEYSNLCMLQSGYAYPVLLAMQVHLECLAVTTDDHDRELLVQLLTNTVSILQSMMSVNKHLDTDIGYIVRNVSQSLLKKESNFKTIHEAVVKETDEMYLPMTDSTPDTLETYSTDLLMGNDQLMFL
jgi:hypothetical protein